MYVCCLEFRLSPKVARRTRTILKLLHREGPVDRDESMIRLRPHNLATIATYLSSRLMLFPKRE